MLNSTVRIHTTRTHMLAGLLAMLAARAEVVFSGFLNFYVHACNNNNNLDRNVAVAFNLCKFINMIRKSVHADFKWKRKNTPSKSSYLKHISVTELLFYFCNYWPRVYSGTSKFDLFLFFLVYRANIDEQGQKCFN